VFILHVWIFSFLIKPTAVGMVQWLHKDKMVTDNAKIFKRYR